MTTLEAAQMTAYQQKAERVITIIQDYRERNPIQNTCAGLFTDLCGSRSQFLEDTLPEMRSCLVDILAFLAIPENAQKFQKFMSVYSDNYAKHLRTLINFLCDANNKSIQSEVSLYELDSWTKDDKDLESLERYFDR